MTRNEAKKIQSKYGMEILRHPVTGEAWGLHKVSNHCIKELDDLTNAGILPCAMEVCYHAPDYITYTLACPVKWFDRCGWADE